MHTIDFKNLATYLKDVLKGNSDFLIELGEQAGIGASSLLGRKCGLTFLIDRGIAFSGNGDDKVTILPIGKNLEGIHIDLMIFTHVHADHAALIVPTVINHPESRVVFSKKTHEEGLIMLHDTLKNQDLNQLKARQDNLPEPEVLFTRDQLAEFIRRSEVGCYEIIDTDRHDVWITWEDWPDWQFGFTFAGHTKGAFMSFFKAPDGDGLIFTGDVASHDQEILDGVPFIDEEFLKDGGFDKCRKVILVTEATNGNRDRVESQDDMDSRLKSALEETRNRGGIALLPVFAINRGPNMVAKLIRLGFNVTVAGLVQETIKAEIEPKMLNKWLSDGSIKLFGSKQSREDRQASMDSAIQGKYDDFRPIITSSATLDQGMSVAFAFHVLPERENVLISTGHRFDGSAMKEVFEINDNPIELGRTINLTSFENRQRVLKPIHVRCDVHHFDYSAHDFREGLVNRVMQLSPDVVFVKHCAKEGFDGLNEALQERLKDSCPPVKRLHHMNLIKI